VFLSPDLLPFVALPSTPHVDEEDSRRKARRTLVPHLSDSVRLDESEIERLRGVQRTEAGGTGRRGRRLVVLFVLFVCALLIRCVGFCLFVFEGLLGRRGKVSTTFTIWVIGDISVGHGVVNFGDGFSAAERHGGYRESFDSESARTGEVV